VVSDVGFVTVPYWEIPGDDFDTIDVTWKSPVFVSANKQRFAPGLPTPHMLLDRLNNRCRAVAPGGIALNESDSGWFASVTQHSANVERAEMLKPSKPARGTTGGPPKRSQLQGGFVGRERWLLGAGASPDVRTQMARLLNCAPMAGMGEQTALGFGEVALTLSKRITDVDQKDRSSQTRPRTRSLD